MDNRPKESLLIAVAKTRKDQGEVGVWGGVGHVCVFGSWHAAQVLHAFWPLSPAFLTTSLPPSDMQSQGGRQAARHWPLCSMPPPLVSQLVS